MSSGEVFGKSYAPAGYERIHEEGVGNCLSHAIARQVVGGTRLAAQIRHDVCDWMESHLTKAAQQGGRCAPSNEHRMMTSEERDQIMPSHAYDDDETLAYIRRMRQQ